MSSDDHEPMSPGTLWVFWGLVWLSLAIYLTVLSATHLTADRGYDPAFIRTIVMTFSGVSAAIVALVFWVRRRMFFARKRREGFESSRQRDNLYFTMSLISWGLSEFVAVLGLALGLMTYNVFFYLPFAAVTGTLLLIFRPSEKVRT